MRKSVFYGNIIDGTGRDMIPNGMVVVDGSKIEYVGKREECYQLPQDVIVYDYTDGYILPGLIEAHSHLAGYGSNNTLDWVIDPIAIKVCQIVYDCNALLDAGYTSVRDVGGIGAEIRRAMERGLIHGPRIFTTNAAISPTAGHADVWADFSPEMLAVMEPSHAVADGVEECRKMARTQFRRGADFIKIMTTGGIMDTASNPGLSYYSHDEIAVFVEEAERMGTYVATHAESDAGVYNAVMAGVKSIEHGYMTTDKTLEAMLKNGCWQVPTLSAMAMLMENVDTMIPVIAEKVRFVVPKAMESVARARKAGIPMACGADYLSVKGQNEYGGKNCREMLEFTKVGYTPMEAIVCATKMGAMVIKREEDLGTLEVGKLADIIVLKENPLENISCFMNTKNTKLVMKDGIIEKIIP